MSRSAASRITVLALVGAVVAAVVRALRGPAAPVFSTPSRTDGLLSPSGHAPATRPTTGPGTPAPLVDGDREEGDEDGPEPVASAAPDEPAAAPDEPAATVDQPAAPDTQPETDTAVAAGSAAEQQAQEQAERRWAYPVDGECPPTHPIKAKLRSGIYHLPGMMAYDRARPDRCYATEADAQADGLRRAKR